MTPSGQPPSPGSSAASGFAQLQALETKLYSQDVVSGVEPLAQEQRDAFVAARLALTSTIDQLETGMDETVGQRLAQESSALSADVQDLNASLDRLDDAASWAGKVNSLVGLVDKIAPDVV
ncbi:MAG TPA: hypothetical protein VIJ02_02325 [Thermoanaerobaculia bacterium]